ncbi:unnamed protein product [Clavelina lepadiformis]|uniref:Uncharacterized protein n=1 Tax=Clavelina lepadiformis TaxID=159417 RepID=A0ABP0GEQ2_CLALP
MRSKVSFNFHFRDRNWEEFLEQSSASLADLREDCGSLLGREMDEQEVHRHSCEKHSASNQGFFCVFEERNNDEEETSQAEDDGEEETELEWSWKVRLRNSQINLSGY